MPFGTSRFGEHRLGAWLVFERADGMWADVSTDILLTETMEQGRLLCEWLQEVMPEDVKTQEELDWSDHWFGNETEEEDDDPVRPPTADDFSVVFQADVSVPTKPRWKRSPLISRTRGAPRSRPTQRIGSGLN
jgi:hypothetical protein